MLKFIDVPVITFLVLYFVAFMKESGMLNTGFLVANRFKNKVLTVFVTMIVVGLAPIKNKSMLAAPVFDVLGERVGMTRDNAAIVSYFGTHLHYLVSPLATSLALAVALSGFTFLNVVVYLIPGAIVWLAVSTYFIKVDDSVPDTQVDGVDGGNWVYLLPFPLAVFSLLAGRTYIEAMVVSTFSAMVFYAVGDGSQKLIDASQKAFKSLNWKLITLVAVLAIFSKFIGGKAILEYFRQFGMHPFTVAFAIGLLTGSSAPAVAFAFTLFTPGSPAQAAYLYAAAWTGYMISPVHSCVWITQQMFGIPARKIYIINLGLCVAVLSATAAATMFFF